MTRGKNICKELKSVRRRIAEENDIPLEIKECTYEGPCRGTCPRCEAEVRYLERELAHRVSMGKVATVAGLALGLASCGHGNSGTAPDTDEVINTGEPLPPVEETDTVKHIADTTKPLWREPDNDFIVTGDMCIMPIDSLYEEGEADDEALFGIINEPEPEFPGGTEAMYKFIQDNLKYPQLALDNGIQGRVFVTFVVEKDGSVSNVRVLRDIGGGCGAEAKRVVEMMPKWTPGKQSGIVVRTQYNLPVNFVLPKDRPQIIEGGAEMIEVEAPHETIRPVEIGPNGASQQLEVEGVKVIVR